MTEEQRELLEQYEAGVGLLRGVLELVPREQWDTPPAPGEWTARQVLVHLGDSEIVGAGRIRQLLAEEHPTLFMYRQEEWAAALSGGDTAPEEAVALALVLRRSTAALLRRVVTAEAWTRTALHPVRGAMDLATLLRLYAGHIEGHVAQLRGIAAALA